MSIAKPTPPSPIPRLRGDARRTLNIEGGKLLFSVRDNGCGFDPDTAPGMAQGHFGLQGIRDRIESFEGEMSVQSAPGKGAKVTIALTVPQGTEEVLS